MSGRLSVSGTYYAQHTKFLPDWQDFKKRKCIHGGNGTECCNVMSTGSVWPMMLKVLTMCRGVGLWCSVNILECEFILEISLSNYFHSNLSGHTVEDDEIKGGYQARKSWQPAQLCSQFYLGHLGIFYRPNFNHIGVLFIYFRFICFQKLIQTIKIHF